MKNSVRVFVVCVGIALPAAFILPLAFGRSLVAQGVNTKPVKPRQPSGVLVEQLGVYRTIEGFLADGVKVETGTLLVDTVDGKKLDAPLPLVIRGAVVENHNLQPARLDLPPRRRCILKGFETGEMIGVPPAVTRAAQEQGWNEVPMSPIGWQWRSYFVALVVVEPKDIELRKQ